MNSCKIYSQSALGFSLSPDADTPKPRWLLVERSPGLHFKRNRKLASFAVSYAITKKHEGGYVNDPQDAGGETYRGVSRVYWSRWAGWEVIDHYKREHPKNIHAATKAMDSDHYLREQVHIFYKGNFWDRVRGDEVTDQDVANELFDTGVNMSVYRATLFLQKALNLLNGNGKRYSDIMEDGRFGNYTLGTLKKYLARYPRKKLLKLQNHFQERHYVDYALRNPSQERFMMGWLNRT